jgi:hypothetical protein
MICRVIVLIAVAILAVVPVATAHSIPHADSAKAYQGVDHHGHNAASCDQLECSDPGLIDIEDGQCGTAFGHCSGFLFQPDILNVMTLDWSVSIAVPSLDSLTSGFKPEAETPPPRS